MLPIVSSIFIVTKLDLFSDSSWFLNNLSNNFSLFFCEFSMNVKKRSSEFSFPGVPTLFFVLFDLDFRVFLALEADGGLHVSSPSLSLLTLGFLNHLLVLCFRFSHFVFQRVQIQHDTQAFLHPGQLLHPNL